MGKVTVVSDVWVVMTEGVREVEVDMTASVDVGVVLVLDVVGVLLVEVVVGTLDDEVNVVLEEVLDEVGVVEVELVVLDVELDVVDVVDVDELVEDAEDDVDDVDEESVEVEVATVVVSILSRNDTLRGVRQVISGRETEEAGWSWLKKRRNRQPCLLLS